MFAPGQARSGTLRSLESQARPASGGAGTLPVTDLPPILGVSALAFVGRSRELEALARAFAAAAGGSGRLVLFAGEAGIGKTRTAQEFAAAALGRAGETDRPLVLWGRCYEGGWSPPYAPWAEVLADLARTVDPDWLRRMVGLGAPTLAQLVPAIRAALPDAPPPATLPPEEERYRLYDAVVGFLLGAARSRPIITILDDLHWADPASLGLLRHLGRFVDRSRLLVIGLYRDADITRDHPLAAVLAELRREPGTQALRLRGLSPSEVHDFLNRAARRSIAPELADAITRETDGNPFFTGELLRHLLEEDKLVERDGRWTAAGSLDDLGIPEGVRQVVARRLSHLSPETNRLLGYAAVFTGGFDFRVLQALTELPEDALLDGLDEALAAGLIRAVDGKTETYDFVHAIVRHTISDGWGPSRRVRLHRRLAEALERVHAGRELDVAAELAYQYHESATLPGAAKGIVYALAAADRAKASSAREQAVAFLRMARDLIAGAPTIDGNRGGVLSKLAIAEAEALLHADAQRTIEEVLTAFEESAAEPETVAAFLAAVAAALKDNGADDAVWRPLVERGLRVLGERHDLTWARLTLLLERFAPISSGTIFAARWLGVDPEAVAIARASGEEDDFARTLQPFEGRSRAETDALLARVRTWQRPAALIRALMIVGADLVYSHGAFREAIVHFNELLAVSERSGSTLGKGEALVRIALARIALGEREAALRTAEAAREAVARLSPNHRLHASLSWIDAFLAEYWGGDWAALARFWTRFVGDPSKAESAIVLDDAALAAFAHVRAGTTDEGRRLLEALTAGLAPLDPDVWLLNGAVAVGAAAVWELETADLAPVYLDLARDLIAAGVGDYLCCSNELTVARMLALLGRRQEAGAAFERARERLDLSGQRPLRAIVDYDEALMLHRAAKGQPDPASRERIASLLDAAIAAFEALEMPGWVEGARAVRPAPAVPNGRKRAGLPAGLTSREVDILQLVVRGHSDRQISEQLYLSPRTVNAHIRHMLAKTLLANRTELSVWAVEQGLVER